MYQKFKPASYPPFAEDVPTIDEVIEPIVENGSVRKVITKQIRVENPNKDYHAEDFEISTILASGNTDLLKKVPLVSVSDMAAVDATSSQAAYIETLSSQASPASD